MATNSLGQIVNEIEQFVFETGKKRYFYYVGITNDYKRRLKEHNVIEENGGSGIALEAVNENVAREAEKHFLASGMTGGDGGGSDDTPPTFVYCYVMVNGVTKPSLLDVL